MTVKIHFLNFSIINLIFLEKTCFVNTYFLGDLFIKFIFVAQYSFLGIQIYQQKFSFQSPFVNLLLCKRGMLIYPGSRLKTNTKSVHKGAKYNAFNNAKRIKIYQFILKINI